MTNEALANEIERLQNEAERWIVAVAQSGALKGIATANAVSEVRQIIRTAAALRANAAPQGGQGSDSIYNEVCAKLIITSVAEYMREVGHGDDIVNLIKSFNPKAHHTFNASLAEIDRFVNSLDDTP